MMTAFTRIVIVLSLLRQAMGTMHAPPNQVIVGLSLFLTFFIMAPVFDKIYDTAWKPYSDNQISLVQAADRGAQPLKSFMLKQTRQEDLALFVSLAKVPPLGTAGRHAAESAGAGLCHQRAEDRVPDRLHRLHSLPDHRHGGGQRADVDGHDDAVAGDGVAAVQDHAVRAGGWLESADRLAGADLPDMSCEMTPDTVIAIVRQALEVTMLAAGPLLLASLADRPAGEQFFRPRRRSTK